MNENNFSLPTAGAKVAGVEEVAIVTFRSIKNINLNINIIQVVKLYLQRHRNN